MLKLTDIRKDALLKGIVPSRAVKVVSVEPIGEDAVTVYYRDDGGQLAERMLFRSDEAVLEVQEEGRPWSLDGNGAHFKLAAEAYRIHLAHLFDPLMAVHTSNVEPLPHQITAGLWYHVCSIVRCGTSRQAANEHAHALDLIARGFEEE